jgi:hypothetical protein
METHTALTRCFLVGDNLEVNPEVTNLDLYSLTDIAAEDHVMLQSLPVVQK